MNITDEEKMAMCISSYAQIEDKLDDISKDDGLPCTLGEIYAATDSTLYDTSNLGEYINPLPEGKTGQTYEGSADLSNWEVVDYYDSNTETGFFGMVLQDPDTGDLAVVFRGSETFWEYDNMYEQAKLDWVQADLGLLTGVPTPQQLEVEAFMKQIAESDYYNSADNPSLTFLGHSLGGHLAEHTTIVAEKCGIDLDRLEHCYSLDGQGFPDEYLEMYAAEIEGVEGKMTHYTWSAIGNLLNPIPGTEEIVLDVKPSDNIFYDFIGKHDMHSVYFDKSGRFAVGELGNREIIVGGASRGLDRLPPGSGFIVATSISILLLEITWLIDKCRDENGNLTPLTWRIIISVIMQTVVICGFNPALLGGSLIVMGIIIVMLILVAIAALDILFIFEQMMELAEVIVAKLGEIYQWSQEQMSQLLSYIGETLQDMITLMQIVEGCANNYIQSHTLIRVDTYKLREYARRLEYLNRMLVDIDLRLDRLYGKTKWTDLGTLLQADLLVRESSRLKNCMDYLNETADSFELAEENILRAFG